MNLSRRGLLGGLLGSAVAPAVPGEGRVVHRIHNPDFVVDYRSGPWQAKHMLVYTSGRRVLFDAEL